MARPTKAQERSQKVEDAENAIRDKLPELTAVLLKTAIEASIKVTCPHCRHPHDVERIGDPKVAMALLERVAGKATEKRTETSVGAISKLLTELAGAQAATGLTPQEQAQKAIEEAKARAAAVAALRAAKV